MRVVILYDPGADDWTAEDVAGVMEAVDDIARIFVSFNHQVQRVPVRHDMRWFNVCRRADLVFNLCEGVRGVAQWEDHVVGTLELAGIAYTGCGPWTTSACRRKAVANTLLERAGLPVPRWTIAQGKIDDDFPLPAIVKPAAEDASTGLDRQSVVSDRKSLKARIAAMTEQFDEVLVQQYIAGREFNVGIVGTRTLPVAEIDFSTMPEGTWPILTYAAKWHVGSPEDIGSRPVCPAQMPQRLADRLCRLAETAWRTMQGKSYGRIDLRVDDAGRPWILEVNPNPDLTDEAGLSRMAKAAGWDYPELIRRIAELALRELGRAHRARLERLTRATGLFREEEVATAVGLLDESLAGDEDYQFVGGFEGDELIGYGCWGPTPGTVATSDLYWIVVDRVRQGAGIGSQLLAEVERRLKADGRRLVVVETSSRPDYKATRGFYEARGYTRAATIPGYYAPGDDLVIYTKDLTAGDLARTTP